MKAISIRELPKNLKKCVDTSQSEKVVIIRYGKPVALMIGLEGMDWETVVLQSSHQFWELIQQRRKQETISFEEMKNKLKMMPFSDFWSCLKQGGKTAQGDTYSVSNEKLLIQSPGNKNEAYYIKKRKVEEYFNLLSSGEMDAQTFRRNRSAYFHNVYLHMI